MAPTLKLSQITGASGAPALTDTLVGVRPSGPTDFLYTLSQVASTLWSSPTLSGQPTSPQFAVIGGGGGSLVYSGTFSSSNAALWSLTNWTGNGTSSIGELPLNRIAINGDQITAGNNASFVEALQVQHFFGGSAATGGRHALVINMNQTAATGNFAANPAVNPFHVGTNIFVDASFNEGGTSTVFGHTFGQFFAFNPVVRTHSGATNLSGVVNTEFNIQCLAGSSTYGKVGIQVIKETNDAVQGAEIDAAIIVADQGGTLVGWLNGLQIGSPTAKWPIDPNGTIIGSKISQDYATNQCQSGYGIDFVQTAFANFAFRSNGFSVSGSGVIQVGTGIISASAVGFNVDSSGAVGSAASVASGGTSYTNGDIVLDLYGGVYQILTTSGGVVLTISILVFPNFSSNSTPSNPVATTRATSTNPLGSGLTLNLTWNTSRTTLSLSPSGGQTVVGGRLTMTPNSSVTLSTNGQMEIQTTSNTSLTFKYRGSDGVTRSASLTLS